MSDSNYPRRAGAAFRGIINDLKRNTETAAAELEVPVETIERIIAGEQDVPPEVLRRAVRAWPVNERDFHPVHDDAPSGVVICRAADSAGSSRLISRGGTDYYEYRDTAMSRVAAFRPEWIRMLVPVGDADPHNCAVQWNNGHFLYQFTYFIGEVNYYYEWQGQRHCIQTGTGDSVFGLPYAPHSFTYRAGGSGLILALTYGGRLLGDAQHELGALGPETAARYAPRDRSGFPEILRERLADSMITAARLAEAAGLPARRVADLLGGEEPAEGELAALAAGLGVGVRDLLPVESGERDGISFQRADQCPVWDWPGEDRSGLSSPVYRLRGLAGSRLCPDSRAFELTALGRDPASALTGTGLHEYCYVLGPDPVRLHWSSGGREQDTLLEPGDSLYVKPFVPHAFTRVGGGASPVLVLRIGGKVAGDTRREAAALGAAALRRLAHDPTQWYDPKGGPR